jgi:crotonobetainyl-CoA:carnitine CoA-transferase CaiB-like acyl-CoA transferase
LTPPETDISDVLCFRTASSDTFEPETIIEVERHEVGKLRELHTPVRFGATDVRHRTCAPKLGEHTGTILRECLNYSDEHIAELRQQLII